jgi:hypothetical protein
MARRFMACRPFLRPKSRFRTPLVVHVAGNRRGVALRKVTKTMIRLRAKAGLTLAFSLLMVAGCGDSGPKEAPVAKAKGIVTYQGKAVAGATVTFTKEGASRTGSGVTNSEGRFEISTYANNDGAIIGDNVVTVIKKTADASSAPPVQPKTPEEMAKAMEKFSAGQQAAAETKKESGSDIPAKYGSPATSGLKAIVSSDASKNDYKFDLVD